VALLLERRLTRQPQSPERPRGEFTPAGVWIPAYAAKLWTPGGFLEATINTAAYSGSPAGVARVGNGSSTLLNWAFPTAYASAPGAVYGGVFTVTDTATASQTALGVGGSTLPTGLYGGIGQLTAGTGIEGWVRTSLGSFDVRLAGPTCTVGAVYSVAYINRGINDSVMYVNGVRYASSSTVTRYNDSWLNFSVDASVRATTPLFYGKQSVSLGFVGFSDPGDAWLHEFSVRPWSTMFEPRRILVPVSAGGGSVSLAVADATHGHSADSLTLTSATALTVADATHAHAADNITLTAASVLAVADAAHAHTADSLVLTLDSTLAVAEALHAHAADNVVLSLAGVANLDIADATHAHTADSLVLTSEHLLAIADALHGHAADGLTLTAESVLAIQDALHAHAADNVTLDASGAPTLLVAEALHAHTADGVLLTVSAYLVVSDALHAHTADNILLSIPGAFRAGNPRVWILDARQRYSLVDSRRRVVHLN